MNPTHGRNVSRDEGILATAAVAYRGLHALQLQKQQRHLAARMRLSDQTSDVYRRP